MNKLAVAAMSSILLLAGCAGSESSSVQQDSVKEQVKEEIVLDDWYQEVDRDSAIAILQHGTGIVFIVDQGEEDFLSYYGDMLHDMNLKASVYYVSEENQNDPDLVWVLNTLGIMDESVVRPQIIFVGNETKIGEIQNEKNPTAFVLYAEQVQIMKSENEKDACDAAQACTYGS